MDLDYIIVGHGLAGLAFIETLEKHNKKFVVFENATQNASSVGAGIYNPLILKRFTPVWEGVNQLKTALPFYKNLEKKLHQKYHHTFDTYRILRSIAEQNDWTVAADKPILFDFMLPEIIKNNFKGINAPFGFGRIKGTGNIDTQKLLSDHREYLKKKQCICFEHFDYQALKINNRGVQYQNFKAQKIVFCEGFGMRNNPYFKNLPLKEAKGEVLIIEAPELNIDFMVKSSVFIMPLSNDLYKVGSTFNWHDKTLEPTVEGENELVQKLSEIITVPYKIVDHFAGIRPTVKDRRPLVGVHPNYEQLAILNGLGTRGVMVAPTVAKNLFDFLENGVKLDPVIDVARYKESFLQSATPFT